MLRLRSIDAFFELRDRLVRDEDPSVPTIVIPAGTCGQASGANDLIRVAKRELLSRGLSERVRLRVTGCHGFCQLEPSVLVTPARTFYPKLSMAGMVRVVEAVAAGRVLEDLLYLDPESGARLERQEDIPFFRGQQRTLLARTEQVDPIRIFHAVAAGGYSAFAGVLRRGGPRWAI